MRLIQGFFFFPVYSLSRRSVACDISLTEGYLSWLWGPSISLLRNSLAFYLWHSRDISVCTIASAQSVHAMLTFLVAVETSESVC